MPLDAHKIEHSNMLLGRPKTGAKGFCDGDRSHQADSAVVLELTLRSYGHTPSGAVQVPEARAWVDTITSLSLK